ncbi:MAG: TetR/AcrR family transcriptional regulator [Gammaproteobacteria bacterium]|jgi:TetR/AcrR family transcriptional regulator, transcriptional repressor for nem operon|nr:TetR/AcrR family transcriptional regulator [Gammaproteobacteria bacterium]
MNKINAKSKIITAAKQIMILRGYKATTVDEIIQQAGVAKGSFYHAFKSKEELAIAALIDYKEKGWALVTNSDYLDVEDPADRAIAFVQYLEDKAAEIWQHGCLLGSVAVEISDSSPVILDTIDELLGEYEKAMALVFNQALRARKINKVSGRELGKQLMVVVEGGIISAKSHSDTKILSVSISHFKRYLNYLLET